MRYFFCLLLWCATSPVVALEVKQSHVEKKQGIYYLSLIVELKVTPEQLFDALLDYDQIHKYSNDILVSKKTVIAATQEIRVFTHARACMFIFCRNIKQTEVLEFVGKEKIMTRLLPDESHNVKHANTNWELESIQDDASGKQVRVIYTAEFEPDFWTPKRFGRRLLREGINVLVHIEQAIQQSIQQSKQQSKQQSIQLDTHS